MLQSMVTASAIWRLEDSLERTTITDMEATMTWTVRICSGDLFASFLHFHSNFFHLLGTWHHGEKMPSNRILPHQDPAVMQDSQPKSRQRMQRNNSLRRSWNAQEQPRRRVQRRSSVTKFNLEDSMARVRREEEEEEEKVQEHTIPRTYSTLGAVDQQPQRKTKLRFIFRSKTKTTNSRKRLQGLRNMFIFGPRRSTASTIRERDSEPFTMSIDRPTSSARQPEAVPERNRRFRLWFRRRPKSQPVEI